MGSFQLLAQKELIVIAQPSFNQDNNYFLLEMQTVTLLRFAAVLLAVPLVFAEDYADGTYDMTKYENNDCAGTGSTYSAQLNDCLEVVSASGDGVGEYEAITCDGSTGTYKYYVGTPENKYCNGTAVASLEFTVNVCFYSTESEKSMSLTCASAASGVLKIFLIAPLVAVLAQWFP